jgi:hypothetical protein
MYDNPTYRPFAGDPGGSIIPFLACNGDNHLVRCLTTIAIVSAFFATSASAVREFVILEEPLPAQRVEGVVLDPGGEPIPDMTVSDCTPQWAAVLRSTTTDSKGRFRLSRQQGKSVYYLRFDHRLFNPLGLRLTLDKNAPQRGITARPHIGG